MTREEIEQVKREAVRTSKYLRKVQISNDLGQYAVIIDSLLEVVDHLLEFVKSLEKRGLTWSCICGYLMNTTICTKCGRVRGYGNEV